MERVSQQWGLLSSAHVPDTHQGHQNVGGGGGGTNRRADGRMDGGVDERTTG